MLILSFNVINLCKFGCVLSYLAIVATVATIRIWFSVDPFFRLEITPYNISACFKLSLELPLLYQL